MNMARNNGCLVLFRCSELPEGPHVKGASKQRKESERKALTERSVLPPRTWCPPGGVSVPVLLSPKIVSSEAAETPLILH